MIEEAIEIHTGDGAAEGLLYFPEGGGRWPGVLYLTDAGGIRPTFRDMARRLAAEGYAVLMPNVFYRSGRPPMFDFTPSFRDERTMKRIAEIGEPLTPEAIERDASAYVDFLAAHSAAGENGMAVVGYCMTGRMAMRFAAARAERIVAAASFHGGLLFTDAPTSPHLVLPRIKAELYFGHAVQDKSMPREAIEKFDGALEAWGGKYESEVYEGAFHSWTVADSRAYHPSQADRAFAKLTGLLERTLQSRTRPVPSARARE